MATSEPTKKLFAEYENAFQKLGFRKTAEFFTDSFISAGPNGSIVNSKSEFLRLAKQAAAFYRSIGQKSAKIVSLSEMSVTDYYSLANVHWGVTFHKTGDQLIEFDVSYLVQKTGPEPKIILFVAHQDDLRAMRELGMLAAKP